MLSVRVAILAVLSATATPALADSRLEICQSVSELTWGNISADPTGQWLYIDVLGDLVKLPIEGGEGVVIRHGESWDTAPAISPDGTQMAFISDLDGGRRSVWVQDRDNSNLRRLSNPAVDISSFSWSPDSRTIAATVYNSPGDYSGVLLLPVRGDELPSTLPIEIRVSAVSYKDQDNLFMTVVESGVGGYPNSTIYSYDIKNHKLSKWSDGESAISINHLGDVVFAKSTLGTAKLYLAGADNRPTKLLDGFEYDQRADATGKFSASILPRFAFVAKQRAVYIFSNGKLTRVDVDRGEVRSIPFAVGVCTERSKVAQPARRIGRILYPRILTASVGMSGYGDIAFSAAGSIWSKRRGAATRLIVNEHNYNGDPAISRNGRRILFVKSDGDKQVLRVVDINSRKIDDIYSEFEVFSPIWLDDANVAFAVLGKPLCPGSDEASFECKNSKKNSILSVYTSNLGSKKTSLAASIDVGSAVVSDISGFSFNSRVKELHFAYRRRLLDTWNVVTISLTGQDIKFKETKISLGYRYQINAVSPDARSFAYTHADGLWIGSINPRSGAPTLGRMIGPQGLGIHWDTGGQLTWFSANDVYAWSSVTGTRKIESLRVALQGVSALPPIVIAHARIITMRGEEVIHDGGLVIRAGRIEAVGALSELAIPDNAIFLEATGKTIVPGLVDSHGHPGHDAIVGRRSNTANSQSYDASLAWGVTTLFDPQAPTSDVFARAELVSAGRIRGPRIFSTGAGLFGTEIADPIHLARAIDFRARSGAIMLKSYTIPRRELRIDAIKIGEKYGLGVTSEGGMRGYEQLTHVVDGNLALEHHLPFIRLHDDVLGFLAKSGVYYTPVLSAAEINPTGYDFFSSRGSFDKENKYLLYEQGLNRAPIGHANFAPDSYQRIFEIGASAHRFLQAGGKVTVGSHGQISGLGLHWDMWLLAMSGFTPAETLRAATMSGAEKLGLQQDIGSIEVGKIADLLVLNDNPLDDIRATARIQWVVKQGVVYDAESLNPMLSDGLEQFEQDGGRR